MLVQVMLENWMSFKDAVTFSMIASRERQHGMRVSRLKKYQTRILPVASIYGGNASGKTNFCKALTFAKKMVADGTKPDQLIAVEPFKLDEESALKPTRFVFEILLDGTIYEYSFALDRTKVLEEKLVQINAQSEKTLYQRLEDTMNFHKELDSDQFLHFAFKGTRDNQLFLTNAVSQKVENFKSIYNWFRYRLFIVRPDIHYLNYEAVFDQSSPMHEYVNKMLGELDTGIAEVGAEEVDPKAHLPEDWFKHVESTFKNDASGTFSMSAEDGSTIVCYSKDGEMKAARWVTYHFGVGQKRIKFEIENESDGTKRVINLLPFLALLKNEKRPMTIIVDELDRSLHSLLTRKLIEGYLQLCSEETRSQFIFTTHDLLLMDQSLFRRDEMWVAERNDIGAATLYPLSDFKDIRYDKDIRKSYLQGRMGGIPDLILNRAL